LIRLSSFAASVDATSFPTRRDNIKQEQNDQDAKGHENNDPQRGDQGNAEDGAG